MSTAPVEAKPPSRRRGLRVSLRVFLLLVLLAGCWLGWKANKASRTRRAIAEIQKQKGVAYFDYQLDVTSDGQPPEPVWLKKILGSEYFHDVHEVIYGADDRFEGRERYYDFGVLSNLPELRSLTICSTEVGDAPIGSMPYLPRLRKLDVSNLRLGDEDVAWIASCRELEEVQIRGNRDLGDATLRCLGTLTGLKKLVLRGERLNEESVEALGDLKALTTLFLFGENLGDRTLSAVGKLRNLEELTLLGLTQATDAGFSPLRNLTKLENLWLNGRSVSHWDAAPMASLGTLEFMTLEGCSLGPNLFSADPIPAVLQHLTIMNSTIEDGALEAMAKVRSLKEVEIIDSDVSSEAIKRLGQVRPDIKVIRSGGGRRPPRASGGTNIP